MQLKPATTYPAIVGCLLAEARGKRGLDQAALAAKVGISQSTWSRIERGDSSLTVEQLYRAARALGQRPSDILKAADVAAKGLTHSGIRIHDTRLDDAIQQGLAVIAFATLCILVAQLLVKK
jgi:transcriptional regulator with XRE-family HTH domain